jgi:CRP/FNR family transcriptional regulator
LEYIKLGLKVKTVMASSDKIRDTELHKFLLRGRRYALGKQQVLQTTEDRQVVNIITKGYFRKYLIDNDGNIGAQIIYGPGDIFPVTLIYRKLFNQSLYNGLETFYYEAMSDAVVHSVDATLLADSVKAKPAMYVDLMQEVGRHLEFCIHSLENISLKKSEKRIAHLLWYFAKKFGAPTGQGFRIDMPLTHQNIGEILNITRETVSTNIKELRDAGLIKTSPASRGIVVPDLEKLGEAAYE